MTFRTTLLIAFALCIPAGALDAWAAGKASHNMDCNAQAAGKSGAERETFMEACMARNKAGTSAQATAPAPGQQGDRSACQAEAQSQGLQGNERKAFMADCLSNSGGH